MQYSERIMKILRQREGLEDDDTSKDEKLFNLPPKQAFKELVTWELGSPAWADWFVNQVESVGGSVNFE